jgi:hypothetical protein
LIQPPGSPPSHRDFNRASLRQSGSKAVAQKQGKFCRHSEGSNPALSSGMDQLSYRRHRFPPSITRTPARQHSVRHRTKLLTGAQIERMKRRNIQFRILCPRRPVPYRGGFSIRWRPAASFTAPPPTTPQERSLNAARFCFAQPIPPELPHRPRDGQARPRS